MSAESGGGGGHPTDSQTQIRGLFCSLLLLLLLLAVLLLRSFLPLAHAKKSKSPTSSSSAEIRREGSSLSLKATVKKV